MSAGHRDDHLTDEPRPAGPVGAGDPPPPPVAEASSGEVPPTPPPTGEEEGQDAQGQTSPAGDDSEDQGSGAVEQDLKALLEDAEQKKDEYLELAQRTKADFENYRRRMAAEVEAAVARGKADVVRGLVGVIDNLERALAAAGIEAGAEAAPEEPLAQGVLLTYRDLNAALARSGVEVYDPAGEAFDPSLHEALHTRGAAGVEPGTVIEVMQKGFRLDGQVLRPARVVVSA
jgi:molecular chaperone GrpE